MSLMRTKMKVFFGLVIGVIAVTTGVVVSSGSGASRSQALSSSRQTAEDGYLRQHGVSRSDLVQSHVTKAGLPVDVANGTDGTKCIAIATRNSACVSPQAITSGKGVAITAECDHANNTSLQDVAGLVPSNVEKVELALSDGGAKTATVVNGSFVFEGPLPSKSDPYPTTVKWVDGNGSVVHTDTFPALPDCNGDIPDGARISPSQRSALQGANDKVKAAARAAAVRQGLVPKG